MQFNLVSVIMPVLNGERFIDEALDSVFQQNISPIEMIVVDDGSTDNTIATLAARSERIQVLKTDRAGPAGAKNKGLRTAQGEFIAFLDSDDYWTPESLSKHLKVMKDSPELDATLARVKYLLMPDAKDKEEDLKTQFEDGSLFSVTLGAGLYRKRVFDKIGQFDEGLHHSEDVDWTMRLREENFNIRLLDFVSLIYRRHANNMTLQRKDSGTAFARALKMSVDRRRKKGLEGTSMPRMIDHFESDKGE